MSQEPQVYFLTVEWCSNEQRGIFCNVEGQCFRKDGEPHTEGEMDRILGPFWMVLAPRSEPLTEEEVAQYTHFRPLAEYKNQYGIALRECDVPECASRDLTQRRGDPRGN